MNPKRIIIVRHAQSEANANKDAYESTPDFAFQITETGWEQARQAGKDIKHLIGDESVQAYVSPFTRTQQTYAGIAESISDNVLKTYEDPRIREQSLGHLQTAEAFQKNLQDCHNYGRFFYQIPDGEATATVHTRVCSFIETLHRDFAKDNMAENALIITHGITLRVLVMVLMRESVGYFESLQNPNNCDFVTLIPTDEGEWALTTSMPTRENSYFGY